MEPSKLTTRAGILIKTQSRMTEKPRNRVQAYHVTPRKLSPGQYVRLINYLYPV